MSEGDPYASEPMGYKHDLKRAQAMNWMFEVSLDLQSAKYRLMRHWNAPLRCELLLVLQQLYPGLSSFVQRQTVQGSVVI